MNWFLKNNIHQEIPIRISKFLYKKILTFFVLGVFTGVFCSIMYYKADEKLSPNIDRFHKCPLCE
jgi:hypothetical protein